MNRLGNNISEDKGQLIISLDSNKAGYLLLNKTRGDEREAVCSRHAAGNHISVSNGAAEMTVDKAVITPPFIVAIVISLDLARVFIIKHRQLVALSVFTNDIGSSLAPPSSIHCTCPKWIKIGLKLRPMLMFVFIFYSIFIFNFNLESIQ